MNSILVLKFSSVIYSEFFFLLRIKDSRDTYFLAGRLDTCLSRSHSHSPYSMTGCPS